jgi:uncharacterized protein (DUF1786 family)
LLFSAKLLDYAVHGEKYGIRTSGVAPDFATMMLRKDNRPESLHFLENEIPEYYLRMKSAVRAIRKDISVPVLVMDTAFSAILGCVDEGPGPLLIVNAGNGHTIAAVVDRSQAFTNTILMN